MFIRHLLRRPTKEQLVGYQPQFTVVNLPSFKADPKRHGARPPGGANAKMPTGEIELRASGLAVQSAADVLPLPVAEMDFPLAAPIASALHAAIDRSDTGYRMGGALPEAAQQEATDYIIKILDEIAEAGAAGKDR